MFKALPLRAIWVAMNHLNTTWLWDKVRVQGGAYGGSCNFDQHSGGFSFLSYRDPNLQPTLDIYDKSPDFLRSEQVDEAELTRSIIGVIGDMDSYLLPDAKGWNSLENHLIGYTDEIRQRRRIALSAEMEVTNNKLSSVSFKTTQMRSA